MFGLVPGIHVLCTATKGVDGRVKPGHDDVAAREAFRGAGCSRRIIGYGGSSRHHSKDPP
nr:hypothetical protein FNV92_22125 [Bradyrhizobium cosmicum]